MHNLDRALSEIASIRTHLLATTRFRGISPGFNMALGFVVLFVALIHSLRESVTTHGFVFFWAAVLLATTTIVGLEAVSRARRLHGALARDMLIRALLKVLPFAGAGLAVTFCVLAFAPPAIWLVPGFWLILIGLFGFSVLPNVPRGLAWVAGWYFGWGVLVLWVAGAGGGLAPWMMGVPLGVGHLLVAYSLNHSREVDGV